MNEEHQPAGPGAEQPAETVPDEVYKEVMSDYYKGAFGLPDAARGRSQAAWAIASTIAGALVTAGLIKDVSSDPAPVKILGIAAVFAWLATGAIFMWALIKPLPASPKAPEGEVKEVKLAFVEKALGFFRADLLGVQKRQRVALVATCVAILATTAAIGTSIFLHRSIDTVPATVLLNNEGQKTFAALCGPTESLVSGNLEEESVKQANLVIKVSADECVSAAKRDPKQAEFDLVLPRKDVVGLRTRSVSIPMF